MDKIDDPELTRDWLYMQTSDHFYYMCTKWFSDGDVHKYFNPYNTPFDAFVNFMTVLSDFIARVNSKVEDKPELIEYVQEPQDVERLILLCSRKLRELKQLKEDLTPARPKATTSTKIRKVKEYFRV